MNFPECRPYIRGPGNRTFSVGQRIDTESDRGLVDAGTSGQRSKVELDVSVDIGLHPQIRIGTVVLAGMILRDRNIGATWRRCLVDLKKSLASCFAKFNYRYSYDLYRSGKQESPVLTFHVALAALWSTDGTLTARLKTNPAVMD